MASNVVLSNEEFSVVGSRPIRHDGNDKVTGRARYSADITLPRMLHGKILRSPHAHAQIISIDASTSVTQWYISRLKGGLRPSQNKSNGETARFEIIENPLNAK